MEKLFQLASDIAKLWSNYGVSHYLPGIRNTLILALVATAIGCLIGFVCGILNTIPHSKNDPPVKRFFSGADPGSGPDLRGDLPGYPHGAAGGVPLLRPALFYGQRRAV